MTWQQWGVGVVAVLAVIGLTAICFVPHRERCMRCGGLFSPDALLDHQRSGHPAKRTTQ